MYPSLQRAVKHPIKKFKTESSSESIDDESFWKPKKFELKSKHETANFLIFSYNLNRTGYLPSEGSVQA